MNYDSELSKRTAEIEEILKSLLPKEEAYYNNVIEAMNYSILAGGKRIRPMLMMETFRLFGGTDSRILNPFIGAIEMIHTYSLIHDDLPAMDNDEYRRGKKTTHIVYGEAMAILAGDGLLTYAFETAAGAYDLIDEDSNNDIIIYKRITKSLKVLAKKAGIHGMIGGQVIDIESQSRSITKDRLDRMYLLKTGALIEASMMIGAIMSAANDKELGIIESIAGDIGLAFQIRDDILDVTASDFVLGKPIRSDEKNDKSTYISIMELEQAEKEVANVTNRAIKSYTSLPYRNDFLETLIKKLMNREK